MASSVTPFLMFEGKAEEAMRFYVGLFPRSEVVRIERYGPGEQGAEGSVRRADFVLAGQSVICIDSPVKHAFGFTPAISLYVECETETEFMVYSAGSRTLAACSCRRRTTASARDSAG